MTRPLIDKVRLGEAKGLLFAGDQSMLLSDLEIYDIDDRRLRPLGVLRFWSRRKIRRLGIGSVLLEAFVEEAAKLGACLVHGSIMHRDLLRNPNLIKFYERCGFRRLPPGPNEPAGTICRVELAVPQRADP